MNGAKESPPKCFIAAHLPILFYQLFEYPCSRWSTVNTSHQGTCGKESLAHSHRGRFKPLKSGDTSRDNFIDFQKSTCSPVYVPLTVPYTKCVDISPVNLKLATLLVNINST